MRDNMKTVLLFALCLIGIQAAYAEPPVHSITIENPHAYPTSATQKNGAVFMTIRNTMPMPDKLIGVYADTITDTAELHTHEMDGDVMRMRQVDEIILLGGETVALEPMGYHIMLMGLKSPLQDDQSFRLTLDFEREDDITIIVPVAMPEH